MNRTLLSLALLLQVAGLFACKSQVHGLVQDASFTYEHAAVARIGILGLAATDKASEQAALDRVLTTAMTEERPQLVFAPDVVRNGLGDLAAKALAEFGQKGELSAESLAAIKAKDPSFGYLLIARLEHNRVHGTTTYEEAEIRVNGEKVSAKSEDGQRLMTRSLQSHREILVSAVVYSVRESRIVWQAKRPQKAGSSVVSHPIGSNDAIALTLGNLADGATITEHHPAPPDLGPSLASALSALAENLPEPQS